MDLQVDNNYEYINGRKVLRKHVATIHCTNKLSLLERKISNALLFHAYPDLKNQLTHEITIDQLKRLLGANTRNHKALKDSLKTLISTVIEWNLLGDSVPEMELEGWNASTILSSVSVKKGIIKYQYSELIKTLIVDPSIYGKINLVIQSRFKSAYALALYENCSRYRGLAYTKNFDMTTFRKLMGVEDGKYEIFRDFNRRVLNPAVTEINTCSDIRVMPELFRKGRKVESVKFKIEERPIKQRIGIQANNSQDQTLLEQLKKTYGDEAVNNAMDYVTSRQAYHQGKVKNLVGYLRSVIENKYSDKPIIETPKDELSSKQKQIINWRLHKHDYLRFITNDVIAVFKKLSKEEQDKLILNLKERGAEILGSNSEMLLTTYYDLLGNSKDRIQKAIESNNVYLNTFFENGFTEFLINTNDLFKEKVCDFKTYLILEKE